MVVELDLNVLWEQVLSSLEKTLSRPAYGSLLSSARPLTLTDEVFTIAVPNDVVRDWLIEQYHNIEGQVGSLLPSGVRKVEFVVGSKELFETPPLEKEGKQLSFPPVPPMEGESVYLNPRYTFETFVVGHGNRFAHAASYAVAEAPAKAYNPLFIYGGVGLGKTHLMQAIAHYAKIHYPKAKILYVTCERFTNEFINGIRDATTDKFRARYRGNDLLLVDDIQFLAKKERSQEEFFHTFNTLHESSKQIVLSSDRPPKEIPTLEERLRSRFEWGLTADIQPPDLETRIAILRKKAELEEIVVPDEILNLIAQSITSNIRELEGALIRIIAYSSLQSEEVTLSLAEHMLKDILSPVKERSSISIDLIKKVAAEYYSVKIDDMNAKIRTKEIAIARQVAMYLARELTAASLSKIGEEFGGRDHTTVLHAHDKIKEGFENDHNIQDAVNSIRKLLTGGGR